MGRPADQFCKDNVEEYLPKGRWRCKHCKSVFSGSASRIRNHLSCQATVTDIRACEAAPLSVQEEASKRNSKKRRRMLSSREDNDGISGANIAEVPSAPMATAFQVPSSNVVLSTHIDKGLEQDYTTTKLLVESFISQNISIDFRKAPHFRDFLKSAAQHGIPPCLLRDDSAVIQKSLSNIEHDVNNYLLQIKDSWKITGCTMMRYIVDHNTMLRADGVIYGFYCPEGFIFVGKWQLDSSQRRLKEAFKKHVLSLPIEDVTHQISHYSTSLVCEFSKKDYTYEFIQEGGVGLGSHMLCAREKVDNLWTTICEETGWVHELIQISEKVCKGWVWGEKDADATSRISFKRFRSIIMRCKDIMKPEFFDSMKPESFEGTIIDVNDTIVQAIIAGNEYFSEGQKLVEALEPLMGIIDLKNTLVPTVGYLQVAVEEVKCTLKDHFDVSKYQGIWRSVDRFTLDQGVAAYFNPFYDWRALLVDLDEIIDEALEWCMREDKKKIIDGAVEWCMEREDLKEKLEAEMKIYRRNNPFANRPPLEPGCNLPDPG